MVHVVHCKVANLWHGPGLWTETKFERKMIHFMFSAMTNLCLLKVGFKYGICMTGLFLCTVLKHSVNRGEYVFEEESLVQCIRP